MGFNLSTTYVQLVNINPPSNYGNLIIQTIPNHFSIASIKNTIKKSAHFFSH